MGESERYTKPHRDFFWICFIISSSFFFLLFVKNCLWDLMANMQPNRLCFGCVILICLITNVASDDNLPKFSDTTHELIGYCVPYHGKVCKSYITYDQVWYSNVSVVSIIKCHLNDEPMTHFVCVWDLLIRYFI